MDVYFFDFLSIEFFFEMNFCLGSIPPAIWLFLLLILRPKGVDFNNLAAKVSFYLFRSTISAYEAALYVPIRTVTDWIGSYSSANRSYGCSN